MCGRFTLRTPSNVLVTQFQLAVDPQLPLRFNIAPTQPVAVVRQTSADSPRELAMLHWGLIPSWAKDPKMGARMINARAETVAEKPSFRAAFRRRRCLVLADGYYEWQSTGGRSKQPYYIRRRDDAPFAMAGLWEHWPKGDPPIESCTVITTAANDLTRPIHDRMPVILNEADYARWLDPELEDAGALLMPQEEGTLRADCVSTHVNRPANDDPRCIEVQRELF
jgi:putative SOS response-associated peptidase YedK